MQKKYSIHLIAIAVFIIISGIFNAPVFSGKAIEQNDIKQYRGSAAEVFKYRKQEDRQILWTNVMFSGMPTYLISVVYTGELLHYVPKTINGIFHPAIGYLILLMIGFYLLAMSLKLDPLIGIIGAVGYAFSSYFIIVLEAGHNSKIHAMAYLPGILAGMIWAYRQKKVWTGLAIFSLFTGLELTARHPQMFYYFLFLAIPYGVWELVQASKGKTLPSFVKTTVLLIAGALIAVAANLPYLSNTYNYGKKTIRGKSELTSNLEDKTDGLDRSYVTSWSYGKAESFSLLVPNFKGGPTGRLGANEEAMQSVDSRLRQNIAQQNSYFGDQPFTSGPVYAGAVICLLAFLALFLRAGSLKYVLVGVGLFTMALAWGKNFEGLTNFFLDNVPFYNKFRAVASMMIIPELILPLLAILGLGSISKMQKDDWKEESKLVVGPKLSKQNLFYLGLGILSLFLVLNLASPSLFNSFLSTQEAETLPAGLANAGYQQAQADLFISNLEGARISIFKADVTRSLLFVLLGGGLIFLFQRNVLKKNTLIIGLGLLILADMFPVNKRYLNEENFVDSKKLESNYGMKPSGADQIIMAQYAQDPFFRTLNLTVSPFNDASTSFFHYSLGGYHGAKLQIYQEVVETALGEEIKRLTASLQSEAFNPSVFANTPVLNMLNARYFILNPQGEPLQNPRRLGNAWLVQNTKVVADADAELAALSNFDASKTAILRADVSVKVGTLSSRAGQGTISLKDYDPEKMVYRYKSSGENLALFSDIWYPENWVATIDGEEVEILRANYILRALKVPAGEHEIIFEYRDTASGASNTLALLSSLLLLLGAPTLIFLDSRKKDSSGEDITA
jgi:hypothetical protein